MDIGDVILQMVQSASKQASLNGISELLRIVTESMKGWGTLVWLAVPGSEPKLGSGRLVVLAYWIPPAMERELTVWHDLTFKSMTGLVLKTGLGAKISLGDERIAKPTPRLIEASNSRHFCLTPMKMADGTDAVLEVYRVDDQEFDDDDVVNLGRLAAILPVLHSTVTDRVGFKLLDKLSEIRRESGKSASINAKLQEMIDEIAPAFPCLEVSLFLSGLDDEPGVYNLSAYKTEWEGPWSEKAQYRKGEGATGYVIETGKTVRIVDLGRYQDDLDWISSQYPGMVWSNSLQIRDRAVDYFKIDDPEARPPLSFLCAAVKSGLNTHGAIRVSVSTRSPYYFDGWQARFLEAAAGRIGSWWQEALQTQQKDREIEAWDKLMNGLDAMNKYVLRQLRKRWDETAFFREAMRLAHNVIPNTDNSDVRMLVDGALVTAAVYGKDWDNFPKAKIAKYPLPHGSAASHMIAEKSGVTVHDRIEDALHVKRIFPDTRKFLMAPIESGDNYYGVLIVRSKSSRPFPSNTKLIAGIIGQQLGLYHSLVLQIRDLQGVQHRHELLIQTQARTIGDVHHQVKSPIISAHRAADSLVASHDLGASFRQTVEIIRGLCGKVERVVRNMGMFADLASDKPVRLSRSQLNRERVVKMLRESCLDHQSLTDPERVITFHLNEKSLSELAGRDKVGKLVEADHALVEQCINNLMDNAAKYSFEQTTVRVGGGIQSKGSEFYVSVVNEGYEVKPEEASKLKQRGYRSEKARRSTGEGSGIGLWIVDEIMKAHGGRLAITPTQDRLTDFRLVFPISKGIDKLT